MLTYFALLMGLKSNIFFNLGGFIGNLLQFLPHIIYYILNGINKVCLQHKIIQKLNKMKCILINVLLQKEIK